MNRKPTTGASAIVLSQGRVLLIKRGKDPHMGAWALPGGSHEYGETLDECAARELLEETNLTALKLRFARMRDRITRNEKGEVIYHYVLATFHVDAFEGEPMAGDDAMDVGWYGYDEILKLETTPGTPEFLAEILGPKFTDSV